MATMAAAPPRSATFIEQRRYAALSEPLESSGTLAYRPGHLEKITGAPNPERLEIDGDRIIIITGNDAPRVIPLSAAPELALFVDAIRAPLTGDTPAIKRAFSYALTGATPNWTLTLIPRTETTLLRSVRIEGHTNQITSIAILQPNGDSQIMTITPE